MTGKVGSSSWSFWRFFVDSFGFFLELRPNGVSGYLLSFLVPSFSISRRVDHADMVAVRANRGPPPDEILLADYNGRSDDD